MTLYLRVSSASVFKPISFCLNFSSVKQKQLNQSISLANFLPKSTIFLSLLFFLQKEAKWTHFLFLKPIIKSIEKMQITKQTPQLIAHKQRLNRLNQTNRKSKHSMLQKGIQNYNNFKNMDNQNHEDLTEYQKFRLQKLADRNDDDNFSAHFSNFSCNISMLAKSDRNIRINSFRSSDQNEEDLNKIDSEAKAFQLQNIIYKYKELESMYDKLQKDYQEKQKQAQKYKRLYEGELNRERETKQKLKNWVKEAKTNLNH